MALSEYHINDHTRAELVPHFRAGNHLDFFRGAIGTIFGPFIYNDGESAAQSLWGSQDLFGSMSEPEARIQTHTPTKERSLFLVKFVDIKPPLRLPSTHVGDVQGLVITNLASSVPMLSTMMQSPKKDTLPS